MATAALWRSRNDGKVQIAVTGLFPPLSQRRQPAQGQQG
jgi:hypothetical protein